MHQPNSIGDLIRWVDAMDLHYGSEIDPLSGRYADIEIDGCIDQLRSIHQERIEKRNVPFAKLGY